MDAEENARFFSDRAFIVRQARPIRGADLSKRRAALRHDFGYTKAVADFDEFAARDEHFAVACERGEDEQNRRRAVVDDNRRFGAGEALEELRGVDVALPARASLEVVFEVGVLRRGAAEFFDGGFGERSPAEICMKNDASSIDYRLKRLRQNLLNRVGDFVLERRRIERKDDGAPPVSVISLSGKTCAEIGQRGAGDFEEQFAIDARGQRGHARLAQEFVNRRNLA